MPRKKWSQVTDVTPEVLKAREKRKWQISLRRYVIERNPCVSYAPYFGLDIEHFRNWVSLFFSEEMNWGNFGQAWQFEHVVPVKYFDFSIDSELKLCWNYLNIKVESLATSGNKAKGFSLSISKNYLNTLYQHTNNSQCRLLLDKIATIEFSELPNIKKQKDFLSKNEEYIRSIEGYSSLEFELLNSGRDTSEVIREINFLKKF
jgi:hypothetical protein